MFIDFGLYSLTALHERTLARYNLDRERYEALRDASTPSIAFAVSLS
jgi:hypothetical protein